MKCQFQIQASNPRFTGEFDAEDSSLSDAIQTVFPLETEFAILAWNWIYVPLTYKYDLSFMVDDVVSLLGSMLSNSIGDRIIHWPTNTFSSIWKIAWSHEVVDVKVKWVNVMGENLTALNTKPEIVIDRSAFIAEWKKPLEVVIEGLCLAGYDCNLPGMNALKNVTENITCYGALYK